MKHSDYPLNTILEIAWHNRSVTMVRVEEDGFTWLEEKLAGSGWEKASRDHIVAVWNNTLNEDFFDDADRMTNIEEIISHGIEEFIL